MNKIGNVIEIDEWIDQVINSIETINQGLFWQLIFLSVCRYFFSEHVINSDHIWIVRE